MRSCPHALRVQLGHTRHACKAVAEFQQYDWHKCQALIELLAIIMVATQLLIPVLP